MNRDTLYLRQTLDAIEKIERYVAVGREQFVAETHWQDAVVRQLQIIGEATKRLSPDLRAQASTVDWRSIAGLRNVLVHDYAEVDLATIWVYANDEVPDLKRAVTDILTSHQPSR